MSTSLIDKASYRNRGGLVQRIVSAYKIARYFTAAGKNNVIKHNADFWLTENAVLEMGDNCTIQNYAFFQLTKPHPRVLIGDNTVIGRHSMITAKNRITIGSNGLMGAYVQVIDHNHGMGRDKPVREQAALIGEVVIEDDVWIGAGAKILMDVHVGVGAVIGSNAVVTEDVPPYAVVGGVPARVIKYRE
jgi:acetyltransferase-like isoleucine patch superfamily enzyme